MAAKLRILVQAGHNPPRGGGKLANATGTTREIEFTKKLADTLIKMLDDDGRFDGIYAPGDIPVGIKVDAAVFEHGDGSASPASNGYCFGYPEYAVNKELADNIAAEYDKLPGAPNHRKDNYTVGLRQYYGYGRVNTPGPEVLVESGFLTNPEERAWLFANIHNLASAQYRAILRFFDLAIPNDGWKKGDPIWQNLPGPRPKPDWFWEAIKELNRRGAKV